MSPAQLCSKKSFEIILRYRVQTINQLLEALNISAWDKIQKNGTVYWARNIHELWGYLTPLAIWCFETMHYISILLLIITKKTKILKTLITEISDDTLPHSL